MRFLALVLFVALLFPVAARAADPGASNLTVIKGDVQVYTDDAQDWVAASINMPLLEGDRLWVPEGGRAELHIQGGIYIRLGSATALDIIALQEESFLFRVETGHAYINNRQGGIDRIDIDTPRSTVSCSDNSLVMIDVAEDGATEVGVLAGEAYLETANGIASVEAGRTLHLRSDLTAELSPLAPPDEWENWNRKRDRQIAAGTRSLRYIPEELEDYAYQLDNYGRWVYVTDHGYCWTPLTVSVDWSPYSVGRWCWIRGEYVWISYEPWGWVPHHYGRWTHVSNFGWCWVPPQRGSTYWGPGYVGWVQTPQHVGWVPLAPGEIYYGRGYYGPNSVNITIAIGERHRYPVYRNVQVRNAVTVVERNAFVSGRKERVRGENPFTSGKREFGPPSFKPGRLGSVPVVKTIAPARRPPERVRRLSVPELRRERPVVRGERNHGGRPSQPAARMPVQRRTEPQSVIREQHAPLPSSRPQRLKPAPTTVSPSAPPQAAPRHKPAPQAEPARSAKPQPPATTTAPPSVPPQAAPRTNPVPQAEPARPSKPQPPATKTPDQRSVPAPQTQPSPTGVTRQPGRRSAEPRWQEPMPGGKVRPSRSTTGTSTPASSPPPAAGTAPQHRRENGVREIQRGGQKPERPEKSQTQSQPVPAQGESHGRRGAEGNR